MTIVINVREFVRDPLRFDACLGQDHEKMVKGMDVLGVVFSSNARDGPIHPDLPGTISEIGRGVADEYLQVSTTRKIVIESLPTYVLLH